MGRGDLEVAERLLRRAVALNPNYAQAHHWLSIVLRKLARSGELEHAQRAVNLDPLSSVANLNLGDTLEAMGRYDEAAARYRQVIDFDPLSAQGLPQPRGHGCRCLEKARGGHAAPGAGRRPRSREPAPAVAVRHAARALAGYPMERYCLRILGDEDVERPRRGRHRRTVVTSPFDSPPVARAPRAPPRRRAACRRQ
jgi:tetratricopeptide (TPR) repeat protein